MIQLTDRQRALLEEIAAGRRRPHDEVQRAAMIVQRADGARTRHVAEVFGVSDPTIRLWRARWVQATPPLVAAEAEADEEPLDTLLQQVLRDTPRRGRPAPCTPEQRCHIVAVACEAPADSGRPLTPRDATGMSRGGEQPRHGTQPFAAPRRTRFHKKRT